MASMVSLQHVFGHSFLKKYDVREKIGKGFYASVYRCVRKSDGLVLAVKAIDVRPLRLRENFSRERLMREVTILQRLKHPSIIQLEEANWNKAVGGDHLLLVMEYAPGQELFDAIITNGKFTESDAREIIAQLVSALRYCHDRDIVHRDVKPENILLVSSDILRRQGSSGQSEANESAKKANNSKFVVKLLDFGLSRTVGTSGAQTFAGTPEYFAPEVDPRTRSGGARGAYGVAADCWSLGAVIFVMLSGVFPEFTGEGARREISFNRESYWGHISNHAKDLIGRLMHPDPNERITTREAAEHPWLKGLVFTTNKKGYSKQNSSNGGGARNGEGERDEDVKMGGVDSNEQESNYGSNSSSNSSSNSNMSPRSRVVDSMGKMSMSRQSTGGEKGKDRNEGRHNDVNSIKMRSNGDGKESSQFEKLRTNSVGDKRGRDSPHSHINNGQEHNGAGPDTQTEDEDSDSTPADLANVRLGADAIAFLETDHLYLLQNQLAVLFHEAYVTYVNQNDPNMMSTIRMHAIECRQLFKSSAALMNKLGGTANNVMDLIPDLKAGVEENEPEFAEMLFTKIKGWISELKGESKKMMDDNSRVIRQLNISMENAKQGLLESVTSQVQNGRSPNQVNGLSRSMLMGVVETASPMVEVMRPRGHSIFGKDGEINTDGRGRRNSRGNNNTGMTTDVNAMNLDSRTATLDTSTMKSSSSVDSEPSFEEVRSATSSPVHRASRRSSPPPIETDNNSNSNSSAAGPLTPNGSIKTECTQLVCTPPRSPSSSVNGSGRKRPSSGMNNNDDAALVFRQRVQHLQRALAKLTQVDRILGGFSMFWDQMETTVTLLSQKNDHVESLLSVTKNPKLKKRFFTRLGEYSHMWKAVALASKRYQSSETGKNGQHIGPASQYQAIEDGSIGNIGNGDSRHQRGNSQTSNDSARQPSFEGRQPSFEEAGDAMDIQQMPSL